MILNTLLTRLRDSEELSAIIESIEPFYQEGPHNGIVYSLTPLGDNGATRQDRFEIHIIAKSIEEEMAADAAVRKILLTLGDEKYDNIYNVELSGGGSMEDLNTMTYHLIQYYIITSLGGRLND